MFLVNLHATGVTHVSTAFGDSVKEHLLVAILLILISELWGGDHCFPSSYTAPGYASERHLQCFLPGFNV